MRDKLVNNNVNNGMDVASVFVTLGAIGEFLPPIAAFLAIVWSMIRIYEWARVRVFKVEVKIKDKQDDEEKLHKIL